MSGNKQIAKNSLILTVRLIITSLSSLYLTRLLLVYLGISDFGLYSVVGSLVIILNFLSTVMVSTTYRFIAFEIGSQNLINVNKVFNVSLIIHLAIAILGYLISEFFGVWYVVNKLNISHLKIYDAVFVFRVSILTGIISVVSIPFQGLLIANEKFSVGARIDILKSVLILVFVFFLLPVTSNKLKSYAIITLSAAIISSLLFIFYSYLKYKEYVKWNFQKNLSKYKEMAYFSGWILFGAAAQVGKDTGSQLVINRFFGTILNSAFGIANGVNMFVKVFSNNLVQAAVPQIVKSSNHGDKNRSRQLVTYLSKYSFFLMYFLTLPIILETEFIIKLWLGTVPTYTVSFCRLMLINGLIDSLLSSTPAAIHASGKIKWFQLIMSTVMVISLPVSYFMFVLGFNPSALFIVYISTSIVNLIIGIYLLKKILNFDIVFLVKYSFVKIFIVIVSTIPLFIITYCFKLLTLEIIFFMIITQLWVLTTIYFFGLDSSEKATLHLFINKLYRKFFLNI